MYDPEGKGTKLSNWTLGGREMPKGAYWVLYWETQVETGVEGPNPKRKGW